MVYGIGYQGSKSQIVEEIIEFLPRGKRLVDLCGGGFAVTHCAMLRGKWEKYLYNEYNSGLVELIKRSIKGEYNYGVFTPRWISREEFKEKKEKDSYVKYVWSFSNNGFTYFCGKDKEEIAKSLHNYVVYKKKNEYIENNYKEIDKYVVSEDISTRRKELGRYFKELTGERKRQEQLERLERLQQLERLERLPQLERLEITNKSYEDYEYEEGDVVYIDPPYENTKGYNEEEFDHQKFYDWVASREYEVYFSSYEISDTKRFKKVWCKEKRSLMCRAKYTYNNEYIYTQRWNNRYKEIKETKEEYNLFSI